MNAPKLRLVLLMVSVVLLLGSAVAYYFTWSTYGMDAMKYDLLLAGRATTSSSATRDRLIQAKLNMSRAQFVLGSVALGGVLGIGAVALASRKKEG